MFVVILLVGLAHVALLLLYVPAFVIAVALFVDGSRSERPPVLLGWVPAVLAFLAIPAGCLVALDALSGGVLDGRSLLAPAAVAVWFAAWMLARGVRGRDHSRRGEPADRRLVVAGSADPSLTPLDPRTCEEMALAAPVTEPPEPWCAHGPLRVSDVRGLGFAKDPETGRELMLVVSPRCRDLFETLRGHRVARDVDPDEAVWRPDAVQLGAGTANVEYVCPGLGPLEDTSVRMAGFGGAGLARDSAGWTFDVVTDPTRVRVVLGYAGGLYREDADWWVVHDVATPPRLMGFSSSGRTLVLVTDDELWWAARPWQARPEFGR